MTPGGSPRVPVRKSIPLALRATGLHRDDISAISQSPAARLCHSTGRCLDGSNGESDRWLETNGPGRTGIDAPDYPGRVLRGSHAGLPPRPVRSGSRFSTRRTTEPLHRQPVRAGPTRAARFGIPPHGLIPAGTTNHQDDVAAILIVSEPAQRRSPQRTVHSAARGCQEPDPGGRRLPPDAARAALSVTLPRKADPPRRRCVSTRLG